MSRVSPILLVTASYDSEIRLWNPKKKGEPFYKSFVHEPQVNSLVITSDKRNVVAAGNPNISTYDVSTDQATPVKIYVGHSDNVVNVGFEIDNRWMFSASEDKTVKIWSINSPGCQRNIELPDIINCAVLHPNQAEILCGCQDGVIRIVDLNLAKVSRIVPSKSEDALSIRTIAVNPEGTLLASADSSGQVLIREIPNNKAYQIRTETSHEISAHSGHVLKSVFSPDGIILATCSSDTTAKIWSTSTWQLLKTLEGHKEWVWDCCFSADSRALFTGSSDRTAILWELSSGVEFQKFFVPKFEKQGKPSPSKPNPNSASGTVVTGGRGAMVIGGGIVSAVALWDEPQEQGL